MELVNEELSSGNIYSILLNFIDVNSLSYFIKIDFTWKALDILFSSKLFKKSEKREKKFFRTKQVKFFWEK